MTRAEWAKRIVAIIGDRESLGVDDAEEWQDLHDSVEYLLEQFAEDVESRVTT